MELTELTTKSEVELILARERIEVEERTDSEFSDQVTTLFSKNKTLEQDCPEIVVSPDTVEDPEIEMRLQELETQLLELT
jgi:hypothetical protein